jgi:ankyrin repeat protein
LGRAGFLPRSGALVRSAGPWINYGSTPERGAITVSHAIGRIHTDTVQAFLKSEAPEAIPTDTLPVMMRAALIGDVAALAAMIERGVDPNARDAGGRTVLMEAAFSGHTDAAAFLLERGANPELTDNAGWTALMEAASKGHTDTVRVLLLFGANAAYHNGKGWNALRATPRTNLEIIRLLKEAGAA